MSVKRTAFFVTCLVDQFFPQAGEASVRLLEQAGCQVDFPAEQTCCGQPAFNMGYRQEARRLARRFIEIFEPYDEVVAPSGSCVAMVRVYFPELFAGEAEWHERAHKLARRVYELSEYLVMQGFDASGSTFRGTVTYHESCHLTRELGVHEAPRALLSQVPGVRLEKMRGADVCCGFGGAFSVKMSDLSVAMLDDKLQNAEETGADVLTAADCGCLMHLGGALTRRRSRMTPLHIAEILAPDAEPEDA